MPFFYSCGTPSGMAVIVVPSMAMIASPTVICFGHPCIASGLAHVTPQNLSIVFHSEVKKAQCVYIRDDASPNLSRWYIIVFSHP